MHRVHKGLLERFGRFGERLEIPRHHRAVTPLRAVPGHHSGVIKLVEAGNHLHIGQFGSVPGGDGFNGFPVAFQIASENRCRFHFARQPAAKHPTLLPARGRQLIVVFFPETGLAVTNQINRRHYRELSAINRWQRFSR